MIWQNKLKNRSNLRRRSRSDGRDVPQRRDEDNGEGGSGVNGGDVLVVGGDVWVVGEVWRGAARPVVVSAMLGEDGSERGELGKAPVIGALQRGLESFSSTTPANLGVEIMSKRCAMK